MSNYSKIVDYAAKDLLLHGDPAKAIKGTEVGAEFDAIATMSATKIDSGGALGTPSSGTLTNCTGLPVNGIVDDTTSALGVGSIELGHATDTTVTRASAGTIAVEGVNVLTTATGAALAGSATQDFAAKILTLDNLLKMKTGANIASAATVDLTAATGNTVVITGTTATSALTMSAGQQMCLVADGAWPLTYHATTMNINGGVSYTCAAGDRVYAFKDGGGVIRVNIVKQNGMLPFRSDNTTETLTSDLTGKITSVVLSGAGVTKTLPLLSAVTSGTMVGFAINGASTGYTCNIVRQGTDEISWNGVAGLNSVPLASYGDFLLLVADTAASRWRVVSEIISGPSFVAQYDGAGQSIGTSTATKLAFNTEISDSHGCYDPTTNYRFTPTIPGWYLVSCSAYISGDAANRSGVVIYKNASPYTYGQRSYSPNDGVYTVSFPVYFNGSSDYVEAYGVCMGAAGTFDDAIESNFTATRIR